MPARPRMKPRGLTHPSRSVLARATAGRRIPGTILPPAQPSACLPCGAQDDARSHASLPCSPAHPYRLHINHQKISVPFTFRHGESTFPAYAPTESKNIILLHDPNGHIQWENGADIQVAYATPDATWDTFKSLRVLTGRDFDVEGLAVKNYTYAIVGDELMPALFPIDASTGIVLGPMVRTPDIDETGAFNGKFLSSAGDKVHCTIAALQANQCMSVPNAVVESSQYIRHGTSGGFEGLAMMADGSVTAFLERNVGGTLVERGEPGIRVFHVQSDPLMFKSFLGFYKFEHGACCIADVSPVPGSNTKLLVAERADWPNGKFSPGQTQPNNRVCMIDTSVRNEDMTFKKNCILNYQHVSDPYDVDGNGITTAAFSQWTTEQLIIVDDFCMIAGRYACCLPP
eukprot:scaffold6130_cov112-Isochrysis_galbana.AAC.10